MPPTGNQSERPRFVESDGEIEPFHINQFAGALTGTYGMRWRLIGYDSATNYALEVRNVESTNGPALLCWDDTGLSLLDVVKAQTTVKPGFRVVDASSVLVLSAFSSGVTLRPAFAVYGASGGVLADISDSGTAFYAIGTGVIAFATAGVNRGRVQADGVLYWDYAVSGANIINRSDERIKRNIRSLPKLDVGKLRDLSAIRYHLAGDKQKRQYVGFSAQELEKAVPWAVVEQFPKGPEGEAEKGISLGAMDAALLLYCQHLDERVSALESQLAK